MTAGTPNRQSGEPLRTLRNVGRIQPEEHVSQGAVARALATAGRIEARQRQLIRWRKVIMRGGLAAGILVGIVAIGWLSMSSPEVIAAPTWNDLAKQALGIDTVYIDMRSYRDGKVTARSEIWIKAPGVIRTRSYELIDGNMVPAEGAIASPDAAVHWDERTKLAEHVSTSNRYMAQSGAARTMEAILGIRLLADQPETDVTINGEQVMFVPAGETHPRNATLRGFKLQAKTPDAAPLFGPFQSLVYWFDARSNTLRRMTMTGASVDEPQQADMVVEFDPTVPAGWFEVAIPDGYDDVRAGVAPRLSPEVRHVYDQVAAARTRFGDYRAVIWRDRTGGWPSFREATRGEQWRCDKIDWTVMHTAMLEGNPQGYVKISPEDPFPKLWEQVTRDDYDLDLSAMTWGDQYAILHYSLGGRGPSKSANLHGAIGSGYEKFFDASLRMVAWPEWVWWENLHDHGINLSKPPLQWRLGPENAESPDLVEVIGEGEGSSWKLVKYVFDRSRDWLCVRQEWVRWDRLTWKIEEFGQTPEGLWYPLRVRTGNRSYDYAVQRGAADPAFFEYPEGMPQPVNPFEVFLQRSTQPHSDASTDLPATARGQYSAIGSRGLPRGFETKEQQQVHSEMVEQMMEIEGAIDRYAGDHDWVFPENLGTLVADGYLEAEKMHNPVHPQADPPYGYIRPNMDLPDRLARMVLYEPADPWPGVVTVMFQDGTLEHIHDQAKFEKLLREATSPEPPPRLEDE